MKNKKKNIDFSLDLGIGTSEENGDVFRKFTITTQNCVQVYSKIEFTK